jgi:hypothetical protein
MRRISWIDQRINVGEMERLSCAVFFGVSRRWRDAG